MAGEKLSAADIRRLLKLGKKRRYSDGNRLYLSVNGPGLGSWVFSWDTRDGKQHSIGLGSAHDVSKETARLRAKKCSAALVDGKEPKSALQEATEHTFDSVALELINSRGTMSKKNREQWFMNLLAQTPPDEDGKSKKTKFDYCALIHTKPIAQITKDDVEAILKPIWQVKAATAGSLRWRIESVLAYAKAKEWRSGPNPARLEENLDILLPKRPKLQRGHHKAMEIKKLPKFITDIRKSESISARCVEFTILTCARTGMANAAKWDEINFETKIWTIPANRMKVRVQHQVPLSEQAIELLNNLPRTSEYVFPGREPGTRLSDGAMYEYVKMHHRDVTVHGYRSCFRDWAGDETHFHRDTIEFAMAHTIENKSEEAYRRRTAVEKRRELMQAWANYVYGVENVTVLSRVA